VTVILLARHGETDWNAAGRFQGHASTPLNERGREQARELGRRLQALELAAIYASDLPRALETAQIVGATLGLHVTPEPSLREIDVGSWQGRTRAELAGVEWDGETYEAHAARVLGTVIRIAENHPGGHVLLVTHGGSLRRLQEEALGEPLPVIDNCGVYELRVEEGRLRGRD
jgi:broad specificity phosphatase PhoE